MAHAERSVARSVLWVVGLGTFLAQLDGTVMNVALPALSRAFHTASLGAVQPVITAYLVTTVSLLPVLGKLADRFGRKRLFLLGFAIFGLASLLAAFAPSLDMLVALRVAQAVGGALLSGTSLAILAAASGSRRGASFGRLSVVFALAGLLGPPIGGGLVQAFGWQSVLWLNVPLSLAGIALGGRLLPADRAGSGTGTLDIAGTALFAVGTVSLTAAVATARDGGLRLGAPTLPWPLLALLGAVAFAALARWEIQAPKRGVDALLNMRLLRTPPYSVGLLLAFVSNGVTIALFVLVPFWLTRGWHVGAAAQGLVFLPVALGLGGLAPFAGRRSDTIGARLLTTVGMGAGIIAALALSWQTTGLNWPVLGLAMLALGASSGLFAAPNNNAVLAAAPEGELASAGSMLSAARTLGVILGVGVSGAIYDALQAGEGANAAARALFLGAAALFALNAALCWIVRTDSPIAASSGAADADRVTAHPPTNRHSEVSH